MRTNRIPPSVSLAAIVLLWAALLLFARCAREPAPPPERPQAEQTAGLLSQYLPVIAHVPRNYDLEPIGEMWLTDGGYARQCWPRGMQSWNVIPDSASRFQMVRAQPLGSGRKVGYNPDTGQLEYAPDWPGWSDTAIYLISNEPDNHDEAAGDAISPQQYAAMIEAVRAAGVPYSRMVVGQQTFPYPVPPDPVQFPYGSGPPYLEAAGLAGRGADFYAFSFHHYLWDWRNADDFRSEAQQAVDWAAANGYREAYLTETGSLQLGQSDDWTDVIWKVNDLRSIPGLRAVAWFGAWERSAIYSGWQPCALSNVGEQFYAVTAAYERGPLPTLSGHTFAYPPPPPAAGDFGTFDAYP